MHYPVPLESFGLPKVAPRRQPLGQRSCFYQRPANLQLALSPPGEEYTLCESKELCCSLRYSIRLPVEEPLDGPLVSLASFQCSFCTFGFHPQLLRQTFFLHLHQSSPSASQHKAQGHCFLLCHIPCLRKTSTDVLPAKIYLVLSSVSLRLVELQACCFLLCSYSRNILVTKWKDYMQ